ncbi:flavin reductase family protein [Chloroflexota bacterium]
MKKTVDIVDNTTKFFQHRPVVLVIITSHAKGRDNAMAVGLHSLISSSPPICGISIDEKRFSYELIRDSREFGVNFMSFEESDLVLAVGSVSGEMVDKFKEFNIAKENAVLTKVPIIKKAYVSYECKLIDNRGYFGHRWLVGEIKAVHWQKGVFLANDTLNLEKVKPLLYLAKGIFATGTKYVISQLDS